MIGLRRGHNFQAVGAEGYVKEVEVAEEIKKDVVKILKKHNYKYIDCSPANMESSKDLQFGVKKCNDNNCELFFSIHLNASKKTDAPMGVEIITYNQKFKQAENVLDNIAKLGFKNRGIKHNKNLYELKHTKCKAMIIEVCFVDSKADVQLLERVGTYKIAQAIAYGVMGMKLDEVQSVQRVAKYQLCVGSFVEYSNAVNAKKKFEEMGIDCFIVKKEV